MDARKFRFYVLLCGLLMICQSLPTHAQQNSISAVNPSTGRDGVHDFDWDIGTWNVHQRRLLHPLTGSTEWTEYDGTDVVQKIWDGANMGKVESAGPTGRLEIYTLRLYDVAAHQWRIYFTSSGSGTLGQPVVGEFQNGRGEFYDQEPYRGKAILVRFSVHDITQNSCQFDQAFSADGGKTWETNFIATETLSKTPSPAPL